MRVAFAGTPDFSAVVLRALLGAGFTVVGAWTQPDRPAGRGRQLRASAVKRLAQVHAIPLHQPGSLRSPEAATALAEVRPDVMVVAAYGLILPAGVLGIPCRGCINVHASLLPRWRGAAPIQRAILAGDPRTGISVMHMEEGLDTGPVYARRECRIEPADTAGSLHDRLAAIGGALLVELLPEIVAGRAGATSQDDRLATYAKRLSRSEARLDWNAPAGTLERAVRAFDPWPGAHLERPGPGPDRRPGHARTVRVWAARVVAQDAPGAAPGTVLAARRAGIDVACGEGVLRILELQAPGARRLPVADYLNARPLPVGTGADAPRHPA